MVVGAYSNRIYKDKLNNDELECMSNILVLCNDIKIKLYSDIINNKLLEDDLNTTYVINKYRLNTYYANMVIRKTKETLKSNKELIPIYIEKQNTLIEKQQTKINKTYRQIEFYRKLKEKCVYYSNEVINNNATFQENIVLEVLFPYVFETTNKGEIFITMCNKKKKNNNKEHKRKNKNKSNCANKNKTKNVNSFEKSLYEFECFVDLKISHLKNRVYLLKNKLNKYKQCKENLVSKPFITCFGTKKFFKAQYTIDKYKNNHTLWKKEWHTNRHNNFVVSGSKNHEGGSMCARYDFEKQQLFLINSTQGEIRENKKYAKQTYFSIPCTFLYREEEYKLAYENQITIAYQLIDKGDYFLVIATFNLQELKEKLSTISNIGKEENKIRNEIKSINSNKNFIIFTQENRVNDYIEEGIVALDINVNNFTLVDIDKNGNYLGSKIIHFNLKGLTSNQATKKLELVALETFAYCKERKKPLVREQISNIKFKHTENKNTNQKLTTFAYNKMISVVDRCFYKNDYQVFTINPVYTSQQGKIKYMRRLGLSIHQSAAFCIGRRFLFTKNSISPVSSNNLYYEDLGKYKRFGNIKKVSKELKKLRNNDFYNIEKDNFPIKLENYSSNKLSKYVSDVKNYLKQARKDVVN